MDNQRVTQMLHALEENGWEFRALTTEQLRVFSKTFPRDLHVSEHTRQNYRKARKNYRASLNRESKRQQKQNEAGPQDAHTCINTTDGVAIVPNAEKQDIMRILKPNVAHLDPQRLLLNDRDHHIRLSHVRCKYSPSGPNTASLF